LAPDALTYLLGIVFKKYKRIFRKPAYRRDVPWFTERNDSVMISVFQALACSTFPPQYYGIRSIPGGFHG